MSKQKRDKSPLFVIGTLSGSEIKDVYDVAKVYVVARRSMYLGRKARYLMDMGIKQNKKLRVKIW